MTPRSESFWSLLIAKAVENVEDPDSIRSIVTSVLSAEAAVGAHR